MRVKEGQRQWTTCGGEKKEKEKEIKRMVESEMEKGKII